MSFEHPAHLLQKQGNHAMLQPPELAAILEQVAAEIAMILAESGTGTITIYVGQHQLQVETVVKRKQEPVRVEQRDVAIIRRTR